MVTGQITIRELMRRLGRGEELTPEEQRLLDEIRRRMHPQTPSTRIADKGRTVDTGVRCKPGIRATLISKR
jgi:hypothetical protein